MAMTREWIWSDRGGSVWDILTFPATALKRLYG